MALLLQKREDEVVTATEKNGMRSLTSKKQALTESWRWENKLLGAIALLALIGFGATTIYLVRGAKPIGIDLRATIVFQKLQNPLFYRLMAFVSSLGYAPAVQLLLISMAGFFWLIGKRVESLTTLASAGATSIVVLLKTVVGRPRPGGKNIRVAVKLPDYGFPSGHTAHYVSFYGFLAYLTATRLKPGALRRPIVFLLSLPVVLIGPSRIYLGAHWLSDVIAAYFLGFAYLIGLIEAYERIKSTRSQ